MTFLYPQSEVQPFSVEELMQGYWVKVAQHGVSRVLQFSAGGVLTEQDLFMPLPFRSSPRYEYSWYGRWQLEDEGKRLIVIIGSYRLVVEPDRRSNIHGGYERNEEEPDYFGNFRFIHAC
ncbi:hypothetical protein [Geodermatophilus sp. URMC 65]